MKITRSVKDAGFGYGTGFLTGSAPKNAAQSATAPCPSIGLYGLGVNAYRLSDREADPLPLAIDTDWVFPWTTTWMLPLVLYWTLKNVPA
jgi:hypothetical protein